MILDTCALIWLVTADPRLSETAREQIASSPDVAVSAISAFEIGVKHAKGKLALPSSPVVWFESVLELHGLSVCQIDHSTALRAAGLPPIHSDPCDRIIIATSLQLNRPVVSADSKFIQYGVTLIS